ncbi:hypothetical protein C1878_03450 [Gordonibacter sp. 28C]|uniref:SpaA isopeptide-forming pilin-related protein n=1 Tax=Gordonibacter sp. 28C TaxID=2078569 RepID=UPI000DF734BA|nr:SpaA isopeptide-forming pilin-related protein [Gordonibacter sp. 28C]RDB63863.1 hypothetical protein C1878_03450 [Gordonibacter sp. 28C]
MGAKTATRNAARNLVIALFATALLLIPGTAFAGQAGQDGMTLDLTTDKAAYEAGDTVTGKAVFTNGNDFAVSEATLSVDLPAEIGFVTTEAPVAAASLEPGESLEIDFQAKLPVPVPVGPGGGESLAKTADPLPLLACGLVGLAALAGAALVVLRKKGKGGAGVVSVLLVALLAAPVLAGGGSAQAVAAPSGVSTTENVKILGKDYALGATGTYVVPRQAVDVSFPKLDLETGQPLAGAVFSLQDRSGGAALTATSTDEGMVVFPDVGYGTYDLVETQAPVGYQPDSTAYAVEVGAGGVTVDGAPLADFSVSNVKMAKSVPPAFEVVYAGDLFVHGQGVPGSRISITWPNGSMTETVVQSDSTWSAPYYGSVLLEGQVIYASQTEIDKLESDPASTVVSRRF